MSYILDALRRAEAERGRGAVPGLHPPAVPVPGAVPVAGRSVISPVLVAVAVVAVAAHQRHTVDTLLKLLPDATELPESPEPPRPEFPGRAGEFTASLAAFLRARAVAA